MKTSRVIAIAAVLAVVILACWYLASHVLRSGPQTLTIYYSKIDGTSLGTWPITMRARAPHESWGHYTQATVFYAAVQAVAGPPENIQAIRFPPGTHVLSTRVAGSTVTIDLSSEVAHPTGSFGENGEFKALVYTMTSLPGIQNVQVLVAGRRLETLPGGQVELDQPLSRSDW